MKQLSPTVLRITPNIDEISMLPGGPIVNSSPNDHLSLERYYFLSP